MNIELDPAKFDIEAELEQIRAAVRLAVFGEMAPIEAQYPADEVVACCEAAIEAHVAAMIRAQGWRETVSHLCRYVDAIELLEEAKIATMN